MLESCGTHVLNVSFCFNSSSNLSVLHSRRVTVTSVTELYIITLLILIGLIGNVLSIIVLRKDRDRKHALLLLQALAISDLLYLLVALLRYPLKYVLPSYDMYVQMQPTVFPLLKTCQTITIWMMVLVTLDRWVCVCRSAQARDLFNPSTRRRYAALVFISALIYNLPRFLDSHACSWLNPCTGEVVSEMSYRRVFVNQIYLDIYLGALYLLLLYIAPLSLLVYFNFRLIQAIRYSKKRYRLSSRLSSRVQWSGGRAGVLMAGPPLAPSSASVTGSEKNATIVLIVIIVVFIICESPELFFKFVAFIERNFTYELLSREILKLNIVSELLMIVNSTVNFIVYLVFGRRFRRILREMFRFSFKFSTSSSTSTTDDTAPRHHNCVHASTVRHHRV